MIQRGATRVCSANERSPPSTSRGRHGRRVRPERRRGRRVRPKRGGREAVVPEGEIRRHAVTEQWCGSRNVGAVMECWCGHGTLVRAGSRGSRRARSRADRGAVAGGARGSTSGREGAGADRSARMTTRRGDDDEPRAVARASRGGGGGARATPTTTRTERTTSAVPRGARSPGRRWRAPTSRSSSSLSRLSPRSLACSLARSLAPLRSPLVTDIEYPRPAASSAVVSLARSLLLARLSSPTSCALAPSGLSCRGLNPPSR